MSNTRNKKKKTILCDDPIQRKKNIEEFCKETKEKHKELFDRLANEWDRE